MVDSVWSAVQTNTCDNMFAIDFGKLFQFAGGKKTEVRTAKLFGSRPPPNDSLWRAEEYQGFEVIVYDRNIANHEKQIDTSIVAAMIQDSYETYEEGDEFTLVAGDADYVPAIRETARERYSCFCRFLESCVKGNKKCCIQRKIYIP